MYDEIHPNVPQETKVEAALIRVCPLRQDPFDDVHLVVAGHCNDVEGGLGCCCFVSLRQLPRRRANDVALTHGPAPIYLSRHV